MYSLIFNYFVSFLVIISKGIQQQNSQRVLRGGSWINNARNLRSANRNANSPDNRNHNIGLRLAGALLDYFYRKSVIQQLRFGGGSINQLYFLSGSCFVLRAGKNQDPLRVSKLKIESLQLGRFFYFEGG